MTEGSNFKYSYVNPFSLSLYDMMLKFMKKTRAYGNTFAVLQFMQVINKRHNGMKHVFL